MTHTDGTAMRFRARSRRSIGFTLAEAVIAVAISAVTLGGVMVLNAQQLRMVRSTRQSNAVSMALQDRVEQLRLTAWANLTDTVWLQAHIFDKVPDCAQFLPNYSETVTLTTWGEDSTARMEVVNKIEGGFSVISDGSTMVKKRLGRIDVVVGWEGPDKRPRERSYATIISNGGITRVGLMGVENATSDGSSEEQTTEDTAQPTGPTDSTSATETSTQDAPNETVTPTAPITPTEESHHQPGYDRMDVDKPGRGNVGGKGGVG